MQFSEAYDTFFLDVYCFIFGVLKDDDQTLDVLADVFVHLNLTGLTNPIEIKSFLLTDMRKTTLDYIRFKFKKDVSVEG